MIPAQGQKANAKKNTSAAKNNTKEAGAGEEQVRDIIGFLQYMLNAVGSGETPAHDKDVLITESFSKIFRDDKVQVEDDLDENRKVINNKDVVAYLKDVDFFFRHVQFEFAVEDISKSTLPGGDIFYKVSLRRTLTGTAADGTSVRNTMPRFIEINFDPKSQDLKIVSMYTNQFDETEFLSNWWKELSLGWKQIFSEKLGLQDSVKLNDIRDIMAIEELDLSGNSIITAIGPLGELTALKMLDISGTSVSDLTPLRNLTDLVELNLSRTGVTDLTPLRYSSKMMRLNLANTPVADISVLAKMPAMRNLTLRETAITSFTVLSSLPDLLYVDLAGTVFSNVRELSNLASVHELDLSRTLVTDLTGIEALKNINILTIDSTAVSDVRPLAGLVNLRILNANRTSISSLAGLEKLPYLEKVYCDQSPITRHIADAFMLANPKALVVFDSRDMKAWWESLAPPWQRVLAAAAQISSMPSKEELATIPNIDSVNIEGVSEITSLEPLRRIQHLKVVIAANSGIRDLAPLAQQREIVFLNISGTAVTDISVVREFSKLRIFAADAAQITSLEPLYNISSLQKLFADRTFVGDDIAAGFLDRNPDCIVVYKTARLNEWWESLDDEWKRVLTSQIDRDGAERENLHKLTQRRNITIREAGIKDLVPLREFIRLRDLDADGTMVTALPGLSNFAALRSLHVVNCPLKNIDALERYAALEDLDISNTAVEDLEPLSSLSSLRTLNCSGTPVRKLDPLEKLENLESLDCSNTRVARLDPVFHLPLKLLKCYNSKISPREVDKFRKFNRECRVIYYR